MWVSTVGGGGVGACVLRRLHWAVVISSSGGSPRPPHPAHPPSTPPPDDSVISSPTQPNYVLLMANLKPLSTGQEWISWLYITKANIGQGHNPSSNRPARKPWKDDKDIDGVRVADGGRSLTGGSWVNKTNGRSCLSLHRLHRSALVSTLLLRQITTAPAHKCRGGLGKSQGKDIRDRKILWITPRSIKQSNLLERADCTLTSSEQSSASRQKYRTSVDLMLLWCGFGYWD